MFCLSLIEHDLPLPPHLLNLSLHRAIKHEIERLFIDKVIQKLGLWVSVYDIISIGGGFIYPGHGASTYKVLCRKIISSATDGLCVSLGFFDDIQIPAHLLLENTKLGPDGIWVWGHEEGDLPLDLDEEVHFRITNIKYPPIPIHKSQRKSPLLQWR